ncbi:MAG TPA: LacI family DNA-binding transcriptional regulator [Tepidisphaeraceae bacterium]|jgi:DNA-binding LacI/PurR family transcriptional regulator
MTLQQVAERAGVSAATVCRVINSMPGITPATAGNVHRAMEALSYVPNARRRTASRPATSVANGAKVGFVVIDLTDSPTVPMYDHLLRGVSAAAAHHKLNLQVSFISHLADAPKKLAGGGFDGLILHGGCPPLEKTLPLHAIPTVWLMGNRRRPTWGDQVMPDNVTIGQIAAQYLLRNNHRHVMHFGLLSGWSLGVRALAFQQAIEDAGATATIISHRVRNIEHVAPEDVDAALEKLVTAYRAGPADRRPTGLFVAEDWLVRPVYNAFSLAGVRLGPGMDLDVIGCNNDRAHLLGVNPMPATIDVRAELIGYHAVEHLLPRLRRTGLPDRVRVMLEPSLVLPPSMAVG